MSDFADAIREARRSGDWSALLARVPYAAFIGLDAGLDREGKLLARLAYRPENVGNPRVPALHGGLMAALLESAMVLEALRGGAGLVLPRVVNFSTEFYRPPGLAETRARAEIVRRGRRLAVLRAVAWQDDPARPIAGGHGHVVP